MSKMFFNGAVVVMEMFENTVMQPADGAANVKFVASVTCDFVHDVFTEAQPAIEDTIFLSTHGFVSVSRSKSVAKGKRFMRYSNVKSFARKALSYFTINRVSDVGENIIGKITSFIIGIIINIFLTELIGEGAGFANETVRVTIYF